jgi:hypothetical protein
LVVKSGPVLTATITNAVNNGSSITYTATNSFAAGQTVTITGISPITFNISGTIATAFSDQFTITVTATTTTYVSGGTATVLPLGNLTEWQNASLSVLSYIDPNGYVYAPRINVNNTGINSAPLAIKSNAVGNIVSVFQGLASQTADLTQWQSSTGAIQLRINSAGQIQSKDSSSAVIVKQNTVKGGTITAASTSGGIVTYIANNTFVAGETVSIFNVLSTGNPAGSTGSGFNLASATILSATPSQFTIANALSDTYLSGGSVGTSTTTDVFQVQNSSGTTLARVGPDGTFSISGNMTAPTLTLTNGTSLLVNGNIGTTAADGSYIGFQSPINNTFGSGRIQIFVGSQAQNGLIIRAGGNSTGTITAATSSGTSITYNSASGYAVGPRYVSVGQTITVTGIVSSGNPSGAAGLGFNVINAIVTAASTTSITVSASLTDTYTSGGSFITTNTGLTADLQQWTNSSGTALAKVDYFGNISANNMQLEVVPIDNLTYQFDGIENRFLLTWQGLKQTISNPFRLLVTLNGIIQSVSLPEYVWGTPFSYDGFILDSDGYMSFSEVPPVGTTFVGRIQAGTTVSSTTYSYPFKAMDILLGAY